MFVNNSSPSLRNPQTHGPDSTLVCVSFSAQACPPVSKAAMALGSPKASSLLDTNKESLFCPSEIWSLYLNYESHICTELKFVSCGGVKDLQRPNG